jgi:hypothetical protein
MKYPCQATKITAALPKKRVSAQSRLNRIRFDVGFPFFRDNCSDGGGTIGKRSDGPLDWAAIAKGAVLRASTSFALDVPSAPQTGHATDDGIPAPTGSTSNE